MDTKCPTPPVTFDGIYREESTHIISSTDKNLTQTIHGVHESFLVFDSSFAILMIGVYLLSWFLLRQSARANHGKNHLWSLTKIWLLQDSDDGNVRAHSQRATLNASKLLVAHVLIIIGALINTDLVSYSKPAHIDSVSDAVATNIKVTIPRKDGLVNAILNSAPEDTPGHRFLEHALNQSKVDNISPFLERY